MAGVGFALLSSLDVDSEDTDAKSSFKNRTQKHHEFVDIGKQEQCFYLFIIYTTMFSMLYIIPHLHAFLYYHMFVSLKVQFYT